MKKRKRVAPKRKPKVAHERYEIMQFGQVLAIVEGPAKTALAEAYRYLWQYAQDGPAELRSHGALIERVAEFPITLPLP